MSFQLRYKAAKKIVGPCLQFWGNCFFVASGFAWNYSFVSDCWLCKLYFCLCVLNLDTWGSSNSCTIMWIGLSNSCWPGLDFQWDACYFLTLSLFLLHSFILFSLFTSEAAATLPLVCSWRHLVYGSGCRLLFNVKLPKETQHGDVGDLAKVDSIMTWPEVSSFIHATSSLLKLVLISVSSSGYWR